METNVSIDAGRATIHLVGRFDFNAHREFRQVSENALERADVREVKIDLGRVEYLDSSALGMLLMLRDRAKAANKQVALINCVRNVRQVLDIANFGKLFQIA